MKSMAASSLERFPPYLHFRFGLWRPLERYSGLAGGGKRVIFDGALRRSVKGYRRQTHRACRIRLVLSNHVVNWPRPLPVWPKVGAKRKCLYPYISVAIQGIDARFSL